MYKGDAMQNVFLVNASLVQDNITEAIRGLISDAIVVYTFSVDEFLDKARYYSMQPNIDTIYAVGGDGTVNLLATVLIDTNKKLGIIPMGNNNKIYNSVKNGGRIDIGYINEKIFLNHAIIVDSGFNLEKINYNEKFNYNELKDFEFVTNAYGKYKMMSANSIVISNGFFNNIDSLLYDGKMEVYFLQNKIRNLNKILKNNRNSFLSLEQFSTDLLGILPIIIDGDLYYVSKFDFSVSKKQINIETKQLSLVRN